MYRKHRCTAVVAVLAALALPLLAQAGTLRIGTPTLEGDTVKFPVLLEGDVGTGVSQANFRLTYDPNVLEPVAAQTGQAAAQADKDVSSHMPEAGLYNVIMFGLNQKPVASGEVAEIVMRRVPGAADESTDISLTNVTLADGNATAIPSREVSQTLHFGDSSEGTSNTDATGSQNQSEHQGPWASDPVPVTTDPTQPGQTGKTTTTGRQATASSATASGAASATNRLAGPLRVPAAGTPKALPGQAGAPNRLRPGGAARPGVAPATPGMPAPLDTPRPGTGAVNVPSGNAGSTPGTTPGTSGVSGEPDRTAVAALNPAPVPKDAATSAADRTAAAKPGTGTSTTSSASPLIWVLAGMGVFVLLAIMVLRRRLFS